MASAILSPPHHYHQNKKSVCTYMMCVYEAKYKSHAFPLSRQFIQSARMDQKVLIDSLKAFKNTIAGFISLLMVYLTLQVALALVPLIIKCIRWPEKQLCPTASQKAEDDTAGIEFGGTPPAAGGEAALSLPEKVVRTAAAHARLL